MSDAQKALVAGIIATPIFGFFTIYLFFFSDRPLSQSDIEVVRGNAARVEVVRAGRSADALQVWLTGQSVPFRGSAGYPASYRKETLARLTASAPLEIGVLPTDRIEPRRDRVRGQDFIQSTCLRSPERPRSRSMITTAGTSKIKRWANTSSPFFCSVLSFYWVTDYATAGTRGKAMTLRSCHYIRSEDGREAHNSPRLRVHLHGTNAGRPKPMFDV